MADTKEKLTGAALLQRPAEELRAQLAAKREAWRKAAFKHASRDPQATHLLGHLRRDVARLSTALQAKAKQEAAEG